MNFILSGLSYFVMFYFIAAIISTTMICFAKSEWLPDFRASMKTKSFRILLFFYSPIAMSKKIFYRFF